MRAPFSLAVRVALPALLFSACSGAADKQQMPPPNGFASAESAAAGYVAAVAAGDLRRLNEISAQMACGEPTDYPATFRAVDRIHRYGTIPVSDVGVRVLEPPAPPDVHRTLDLNYGVGQQDLVDVYLIDGRWFVGLRQWQSAEEHARLPELADPDDVVRLPPPPGPRPEPGTCDWVF